MAGFKTIKEPHMTMDLLRQGWHGLKSKAPALQPAMQAVEDWGEDTGATAFGEGALGTLTPAEPWEGAAAALGPVGKVAGKAAAKAVGGATALLAGTEDAEAAQGMRKVFYDLLRKNAGDVKRAKLELQGMQPHMSATDRSQATKMLKAAIPDAVLQREMMTNMAEPTLFDVIEGKRPETLLKPDEAFKVGDVAVPVSGDTTRAGVNVTRAGIPLKKPVKLSGGPDWGLVDEAPWASEYGAANTKQKGFERAADKVTGAGNVVGLHVAMAPQGAHFAKHTPNLWTEMLRSGGEVAPIHQAAFDADVLKRLNAMQKSHVKKTERASPMITRGLEGYQGALHGSLPELLDTNPEVRKALMATAEKPGWQHKGFPDMDMLYDAALDPGLKTGDVGGAVMHAAPGEALTPSAHETYGWNLPGVRKGRLEQPLPPEMFEGAAAKFKGNRGKLLGSLRTAYWDQPIDQEFIDKASKWTEQVKLLRGQGGY